MGNDGSRSRSSVKPSPRPLSTRTTANTRAPPKPDQLTRSDTRSDSPNVTVRSQSQQLLQPQILEKPPPSLPIFQEHQYPQPLLSEAGYDVVIDIQKISDVTTGWPILVGENIATALKSCTSEEEALSVLQLDQQSTVVGVFGLFNRGKTHVVNNLGRSNLASSKKIHTRGLSFIKPTKDIPVVFLDTAGTNSPVDRKYFEKLVQAQRDPLSEKKTTEILIQELAFAMSDVVILVVGELTWPDQEFIESVQRKLRDSDKHHKTLIVVHNFYDITNEVDLLYLWQECVVSTMTGTVESLQMGGEFPVIYFKQQMKSNTELPSIHVFLAREDSEAGKLWNNITYEFLRSKISQAHTPKKDVLHKLLISKTHETLKLYTRSPEDVSLVWIEDVPPVEHKVHAIPKTVQIGSHVRIVQDEWKMDVITAPESPPGHFLLRCGGDISLTHKMDFDGFRILFTRTTEVFQPKFDVISTEVGLLTTVDLPGIDLKRDIKIKIDRNHQDYPESIVLIISGNRQLHYLHYPDALDHKYENVEKKFEKHGTIVPLQKRHIGKERQGGAFEIVVLLPTDVDDNARNGKVEYIDGILSIFLPKKDDKASDFL